MLLIIKLDLSSKAHYNWSTSLITTEHHLVFPLHAALNQLLLLDQSINAGSHLQTKWPREFIDMNVPQLAFAPLFLVWTSLVVGEYEIMEVQGGWNVRSPRCNINSNF